MKNDELDFDCVRKCLEDTIPESSDVVVMLQIVVTRDNKAYNYFDFVSADFTQLSIAVTQLEQLKKKLLEAEEDFKSELFVED